MTVGAIRLVKLEDIALHVWGKVTAWAKSRSPKVHDYTHYQEGIDYAFEPVGPGVQNYAMTGQGHGIHAGEQILLKVDGVPQCYEVLSIDYYSSPSTMWTALLTKVGQR